MTAVEYPLLATRLTARYGMDVPIVLAPMNQVSDARLAQAVTNAGGLGFLGGGYGDEAWLERELSRLAGDDAVGCGFITWRLADRPQLLDLVLDHHPAAVILSFGDPRPLAEKVHAAGVPVWCQVCDLEQARQAMDAGADVIVAQGGESGGHGTAARSTLTLVPEVVDLVHGRAPGTLVVAAGGIADGRGLAASLCLGADGVLVGTRFWAAEEAPTAPEARARAIAAGCGDTVRSTVYDVVREYDWQASYDARMLRNDFTSRWHGSEDELRSRLAEAQSDVRTATADGDFSVANVFIGEGIGLVHDIAPAAAILHQMATSASEILGRLGSADR
jgi:nitronate monooxygenase